MKENYNDILSRIADEPKWFDENGTPRYEVFSPTMCPDIYANLVGLFRIACQECDQEFFVEMHASLMDGWRCTHPPAKWHYGDPPNHDCVGDTMNCEDLSVLEFWQRSSAKLGEWERVPMYEGPIDDGEASTAPSIEASPSKTLACYSTDQYTVIAYSPEDAVKVLVETIGEWDPDFDSEWVQEPGNGIYALHETRLRNPEPVPDGAVVIEESEDHTITQATIDAWIKARGRCLLGQEEW